MSEVPASSGSQSDEVPELPALRTIAFNESTEDAATVSLRTEPPRSSQISRSAGGPSYLVAKTANTRQSRVWDRKNMCLFCERPQAKIARHLQRAHGKEPEVLMAVIHQKGSSERRKAFNVLQKKGNYLHNIAVRSGNKKGHLIPCNRARTSKSGEEFLACDTCKGFFLRKTLWRHRRNCVPGSSGGRVQPRARASMPATTPVTPKLRRVLDSMSMDAVSVLCKTDKGIISFGERLCMKLGSEAKDIENIRNRMRELGRLLERLRQVSPESVIEEFLVPSKFSELANGVRELSGFDQNTNKYSTPSLALKLGQSLKACAEECLAKEIENGDEKATSERRKFLELYELQWTNQVARHALGTLREAKWNRADLLPVVADIQAVQRLLDTEVGTRAEALKNDPSRENYRSLAEVVLTQLIMFNRRRQGEASAMTVDAFMKARANPEGHPEIMASLSKFEQHLASTLLRVVIRGKKGRGVPLLLTKDMQRSVELLLESRDAVSVSSSPHIFVNTMSAESRPLRGCDCVRKFTRLSGARCPEAITSTKLRKHIATMSQVINLKDNELDLLASFLGHDIRVHREVYRMPEATTQLALISKLLLASEKGLATWKGKSLDEIRLEDVPDVEELDEPEEEHLTGDERQPDEDTRRNISPLTKRPRIEMGEHGVPAEVLSVEQRKTPDPPNSAQLQKAKAPKRKRKMWSSQQKQAVERHMSVFVKRLEVPGKSACLRVIAAESVLAERSWVELKSFVHNRIKKIKESAH